MRVPPALSVMYTVVTCHAASAVPEGKNCLAVHTNGFLPRRSEMLKYVLGEPTDVIVIVAPETPLAGPGPPSSLSFVRTVSCLPLLVTSRLAGVRRSRLMLGLVLSRE
jgi:hypothetical protein